MNALMTLKKLLPERRDTFFGRTVSDVVSHDFFRSFEMNSREESDRYVIEVAVPGFSKKDVKVNVDEGVMSISAERQHNNSWQNGYEFNNTQLYRSVVLPSDANADSITAKCRDGVLTIHVSKIKSGKSHRMIHVEGDNNNESRALSHVSWWDSFKEKIATFFQS